MGWNELPVEIMESILSQVYQPDLSSLRFVSRATNHAICPLFWKHKVLCVEWRELPYLDENMESNMLSYPLSQLVTGFKVRMVPGRMVARAPLSFSNAKVEAIRQYNTLSALVTRTSDEGRASHLEEQAEWSIADAGLDVFYRVVRRFVKLQILGGPSLDALFPYQPSPFLETSIVTRSTLYPFRNIEELRLDGVWLDQNEGKVIPSDLIRCLLNFPHIKKLVAHIQAGNENVRPLVYPPSEVSCALQHLELIVSRAHGQVTNSLVQFLQLTKDLQTFKLDDRTMRRNAHGFNEFMFR
ncbi:hypothetical protein CPB86DRAFT_810466 [Serendipita vermifera]|nr:hypothetical protein CPB86DRAFT_810466 [Serendipita vermifera]